MFFDWKGGAREIRYCVLTALVTKGAQSALCFNRPLRKERALCYNHPLR